MELMSRLKWHFADKELPTSYDADDDDYVLIVEFRTRIVRVEYWFEVKAHPERYYMWASFIKIEHVPKEG